MHAAQHLRTLPKMFVKIQLHKAVAKDARAVGIAGTVAARTAAGAKWLL